LAEASELAPHSPQDAEPLSLGLPAGRATVLAGEQARTRHLSDRLTVHCPSGVAYDKHTHRVLVQARSTKADMWALRSQQAAIQDRPEEQSPSLIGTCRLYRLKH
jgi:hypothetical protein